MARLGISKSAKQDLGDIYLYIARDSEEAARHVLSKLYESFQAIAVQPGMGRTRDELKAGIRSHSTGKYITYYQEVHGTVRILRVLHGARDVEKIFRS